MAANRGCICPPLLRGHVGVPLPRLISPRPDLTAGDGEGGVRAREPVTRDGEGRADGAVSMK